MTNHFKEYLFSGRTPDVGSFNYVSVSTSGFDKRTEEGLMWPNGDEPCL